MARISVMWLLCLLASASLSLGVRSMNIFSVSWNQENQPFAQAQMDRELAEVVSMLPVGAAPVPAPAVGAVGGCGANVPEVIFITGQESLLKASEVAPLAVTATRGWFKVASQGTNVAVSNIKGMTKATFNSNFGLLLVRVDVEAKLVSVRARAIRPYKSPFNEKGCNFINVKWRGGAGADTDDFMFVACHLDTKDPDKTLLLSLYTICGVAIPNPFDYTTGINQLQNCILHYEFFMIGGDLNWRVKEIVGNPKVQAAVQLLCPNAAACGSADGLLVGRDSYDDSAAKLKLRFHALPLDANSLLTYKMGYKTPALLAACDFSAARDLLKMQTCYFKSNANDLLSTIGTKETKNQNGVAQTCYDMGFLDRFLYRKRGITRVVPLNGAVEQKTDLVGGIGDHRRTYAFLKVEVGHLFEAWPYFREKLSFEADVDVDVDDNDNLSSSSSTGVAAAAAAANETSSDKSVASEAAGAAAVNIKQAGQEEEFQDEAPFVEGAADVSEKEGGDSADEDDDVSEDKDEAEGLAVAKKKEDDAAKVEDAATKAAQTAAIPEEKAKEAAAAATASAVPPKFRELLYAQLHQKRRHHGHHRRFNADDS